MYVEPNVWGASKQTLCLIVNVIYLSGKQITTDYF